MKWKTASATTLAAALVLAAAAAVGVGTYYANELRTEALAVDHDPAPSDLVVSAVTGHTITLHVTAATDLAYGAWRTPGLWGLEGAAGWYGTVGDIASADADQVVRAFTPGSTSVAPGDPVYLDGDVLAGDPQTADGLPFTTVTFPSDLGPLGAWKIGGTSHTWAILVHGKGSTRQELLRYLPPLAGAALPMLVIDYRNDAGAPPSASGLYDYGTSEWHDVEAAARYALSHGADHLVLFGESMGGGIVMSFLYRSQLADRVQAVVLDAPVLSFADVVEFGAERRNLPPAITWLGMTAAAIRFGISWDDSDYPRDVAGLKAPILLFHGDADRLVNIRTSQALAKARPDLVTYIPVAGGTHARSWNMDPQRYDGAITDFLARNHLAAAAN